eukprot:2627912-Rhodomonas_salina.2
MLYSKVLPLTLTVPAVAAMAPPLAAELLLKVKVETEISAALHTPPPLVVATLLVNTVLVRTSPQLALECTAPPVVVAVFEVNVEPASVKLPSHETAPPVASAVFEVKVFAVVASSMASVGTKTAPPFCALFCCQIVPSLVTVPADTYRPPPSPVAELLVKLHAEPNVTVAPDHTPPPFPPAVFPTRSKASAEAVDKESA